MDDNHFHNLNNSGKIAAEQGGNCGWFAVT